MVRQKNDMSRFLGDYSAVDETALTRTREYTRPYITGIVLFRSFYFPKIVGVLHRPTFKMSMDRWECSTPCKSWFEEYIYFETYNIGKCIPSEQHCTSMKRV